MTRRVTLRRDDTGELQHTGPNLARIDFSVWRVVGPVPEGFDPELFRYDAEANEGRGAMVPDPAAYCRRAERRLAKRAAAAMAEIETPELQRVHAAKLAEADTLLVNLRADVPILRAEAEATGKDVQALALSVSIRACATTRALARIEAKRARAKRALRAAAAAEGTRAAMDAVLTDLEREGWG
jgi:hypothetical protein